VTLFGNSSTFSSGSQTLTLYGEEIDCTQVVCPAIVTQ
jgi:hypothetical protein